MIIDSAPIGGAGYDADGDPLPKTTLDKAIKADAILMGSVGDWKYDKLPREKRPERGLLRIRSELELFANLRPAMLFDDLVNASSLKPEIVSGLDILIVRELTGDIYLVSHEEFTQMIKISEKVSTPCATLKMKLGELEMSHFN